MTNILSFGILDQTNGEGLGFVKELLLQLTMTMTIRWEESCQFRLDSFVAVRANCNLKNLDWRA